MSWHEFLQSLEPESSSPPCYAFVQRALPTNRIRYPPFALGAKADDGAWSIAPTCGS